MAKIKVLIVDDHKLIRDGIVAILDKTDDIEAMGSVGSGEEAVNFVREEKPDLVLMDIVMGGMNGIEATRWIKDFEPSVRVILITMEISKEYVAAGIKSGVNGYLPKDVDFSQLVDAIRRVHAGGQYFDEAIMKLVFEDFYQHEKLRSAPPRLPNDLTKREYQVLGLVAQGKTNKQIADELFISVKTVETHKTHILEKLNLSNAAELIRYAIKNKIISIDQM